MWLLFLVSCPVTLFSTIEVVNHVFVDDINEFPQLMGNVTISKVYTGCLLELQKERHNGLRLCYRQSRGQLHLEARLFIFSLLETQQRVDRPKARGIDFTA